MMNKYNQFVEKAYSRDDAQIAGDVLNEFFYKTAATTNTLLSLVQYVKDFPEEIGVRNSDDIADDLMESFVRAKQDLDKMYEAAYKLGLVDEI